MELASGNSASRWDALVAHFTARGHEVRAIHSSLLHLRVRGPDGDVELRVRRADRASSGLWLMLLAAICDVKKLRSRAALVANRELPIGTLATLRDRVVLRQIIAVESLGEERVDLIIDQFVQFAATLDRSCRSTAEDAPFAYLFR